MLKEHPTPHSGRVQRRGSSRPLSSRQEAQVVSGGCECTRSKDTVTAEAPPNPQECGSQSASPTTQHTLPLRVPTARDDQAAGESSGMNSENQVVRRRKKESPKEQRFCEENGLKLL